MSKICNREKKAEKKKETKDADAVWQVLWDILFLSDLLQSITVYVILNTWVVLCWVFFQF